MRLPEQLDHELDEAYLRWPRAAAWARGQSFGPVTHGVPEPERSAIEELADRILELGEDAAWDEYLSGEH